MPALYLPPSVSGKRKKQHPTTNTFADSKRFNAYLVYLYDEKARTNRT